METIKTILTWGLSLLLALFFLYVGYKKLAGNEVTVQHFQEWGYALWLLKLVGILEVTGALLLLFPSTVTSGAILLSLIMVGASYTLVSHEVWKTFTITSTCLVLLLFTGYIRWNESWVISVFKMKR
jgi:putative oxidoreductase